jgi:transcriptional regulator with XRE-family HTH domain
MGGRSLPANHQLIPMQTQTPIADRLKSWRKSAGLTQPEAARQLGVSIQTLSRWETGKQQPRGVNTLRAIEQTLSAQ